MAGMESIASLKFDPALTLEQVQEGERKAQEWGVTRRLAMLSLTKSADELRKSLADEETAVAFLEVAEGISAYLDWRKAESELLEAAHARVLGALSSVYEGVGDVEQSEVTAPKGLK